MTLTKRGKRVRAIFFTVLIVGVVYWLNELTTPDSCKHKTVAQLSQGCIDILYPH